MDSYSYKPWARNRGRTPKGLPSLMLLCFRDGTLDIDLDTGIPTGPGGRPRTLRRDKDGYLVFFLNRDVDRGEGGKYETTRQGGKTRKRLRRRQMVMAHRAVLTKAVAVELFGKAWRAYVEDLPRTLDVNHLNGRRDDNRAANLALETEAANRGKRPMEPEEQELVAAATDDAYYGEW